MKAFFSAGLLLLAGCAGTPAGIHPVSGFDAERYLGQWFEIVRLDHSFERGLIQVNAEYSRRDDGGLKVVNRGYDPQAGVWREAVGKAYFVDSPDQGHLKVSFFGPFYGGYNIIELDQHDYSYSLVSGPDRDYLWILARDPFLPRATLDRLVAKARSLGFATGQLIYRDGMTPPAP